MSDVEQGGTKSEQATPYKLRRAREKGSVARGTDLGYFVALVTLTGYLWIEGLSLAGQIGYSAKRSLISAADILASPSTILSVTGEVIGSLIRPMAFLLAVVFLIVLAAELVQTGVVFSTEPLRMDFNRLSPANGFKRIFSVRMLIETGKNILKLIVYVAIAFLVIRQARDVDVRAITDAPHLLGAMRTAGFRLLALFAAVAAAFAVLDQIIARRDFARRMRMSRREVRRELRDREGEPRVKQRRRKLHREFAKLSQSLRNIRDADVLITNPTHYAVALKYDPKTMTAPKVVSQGSHLFAQRLKKLAFVYGVVSVEQKELARALYHGCGLNQTIPDQYYRAVAEIYNRIRDQREQQRKAARHV